MYPCPKCKRTGKHPDQPGKVCPTCLGREFILMIPIECSSCKGKGVYGTSKVQCTKCKGAGAEATLKPFEEASRVVQVRDIARCVERVATGALVVDDADADDYILGMVGGILSSSADRRDDLDWKPGVLLERILTEGGTLIMDHTGIWHVPDGMEHGVRIVYQEPHNTISIP